MKKKVLSMLLAAIFVLTSFGCVTALAAEGTCPTVFVNGFGTVPIVKNKGTESEEVIFPPTTDAIVSALKDTAQNTNISPSANGWDAVADVLMPAAAKVMGDFSCNDDGTVKEGTGAKWTRPEIPDGSTDTEFEFCYDWREDPFVTAKELSDFVDYVLTQTHHTKVSLVGFSMGTVILNTYLYTLNGDYSKVRSVVMYAGAWNGVSSCSEPFSGQIGFDATALVRYIDQFLSDDGKGLMISAILGAFRQAGVLGLATKTAGDAYAHLSDRLYSEVLAKSMATCPGMWSMVSDRDYEAAKKLILTDTEKYAALIAKIDNYHYNVQKTNADRAKALYANPDINFGIIAKYGQQMAPVIKDNNINSDTVIDTASESFGATVADLGTTLGEGYVQANTACGHNHISPDNVIDASTGLLPEVTWFIKYMPHSFNCNDCDALIHYITDSPTKVTVHDNVAYPQFLLYDIKANTLTPLTAENGKETPPEVFSFLDASNPWSAIITKFIKAVMLLIQNFQKK